MLFPIIKTKDLNGTPKTLPQDFTGDLNLVFIAYQQWHQREVDSWVPIAQKWEAELQNFRYYELPLVGEMNFVGRMTLDYWMRTGIPDLETRGRTLTLYMDRKAVREQLNISTEDTIAVLLLDKIGQILWQGLGPYKDEVARALEMVLMGNAVTEIRSNGATE